MNKLIDIDKLLEKTANLTSEENNYHLKLIEIDQILDGTSDW
ncbi:hypothetical protein [Neobacillus sp. FSL H8-0543]